MANLKISEEKYDQLLEAKAFADDIVNILDTLVEKSTEDGLISAEEYGNKTVPLVRSFKEKQKKYSK